MKTKSLEICYINITSLKVSSAAGWICSGTLGVSGCTDVSLSYSLHSSVFSVRWTLTHDCSILLLHPVFSTFTGRTVRCGWSKHVSMCSVLPPRGWDDVTVDWPTHTHTHMQTESSPWKAKRISLVLWWLLQWTHSYSSSSISTQF